MRSQTGQRHTIPSLLLWASDILQVDVELKEVHQGRVDNEGDAGDDDERPRDSQTRGRFSLGLERQALALRHGLWILHHPGCVDIRSQISAVAGNGGGKGKQLNPGSAV